MRKPGYYWVLMIFGNDSDWVIAKFINGSWSTDSRYLNKISDSLILEIDERQIIREDESKLDECIKMLKKLTYDPFKPEGGVDMITGCR